MTPTERWTSIFTLVALVIATIVSSVYIVTSILAVNKIENPEEPGNIQQARKELEEARGRYERNRALLEDFFRPLGIQPPTGLLENPLPGDQPRPRNPSVEDPYDAAVDVHAEAPLKLYLNHWAEVLRSYGITTYGRWYEQGARPLTLRALLNELRQIHQNYEGQIGQMRQQAEQMWTSVYGQNAQGGLVGQIEQAEAQKLNPIRRGGDVRTQLEQSLQRYRDETGALWREVAQLESERRRLLAQLREAERTRDEVLPPMRREHAQLVEKRRRLEHLRAQAEERQDPDARVVAVDLDMKIVYLDLTKRDRLFPGMRFRVLRIEPGAVRVLKGEVEVFEIGDRLTKAAITHTDPGAPPMREGDLAFNPYYERGRPLTFSFAGRFTTRHSREDYMVAISRGGDRVEEGVTDRTDIVVAGEGFADDPNFRRARELGVRTITERALIRYLDLPE